MNIAVIGAGNGGQAMAGHFALLGHKVTLYNRSLEKLYPLCRTKTITLSEAIRGIGLLFKITDDIGDAIRDVELIMITTTADAHVELAVKMATYVSPEQVIVLNPGRTLGAYMFSRELYKHFQDHVYIAETQSLLYACRLQMPGSVNIYGVKKNVLVAAYPTKDTLHVLNILNVLSDSFTPAKNVLQTSLENIGAVFHPSVIIFNASAIERGDIFYFYKDMTQSVARFIELLDYERLEIGKACGLKLLPVSEWVSTAYEKIEGSTLLEKIQHNPAYYKIPAPSSINCRLLLEDVPTGILPLSELGELSGVHTPLMNSILNLSKVLLNNQFIDSGRTLKNLGLKNYTFPQFIRLFS